MINGVAVIVLRLSCQLIVHAETFNILAVVRHLHLRQLSLITVRPVAWSERVLKQVQIIFELAGETYLELGENLCTCQKIQVSPRLALFIKLY